MQANDILFVPDSAGKHAIHRATDVIIALSSGIAICRTELRAWRVTRIRW